MATDSGQDGAAGRRRGPSGLFPAGPVRPTYREPHPVRAPGVLAGVVGGGGWVMLFVLLGDDPRSHVWWTAAGGTVAWLVAVVLARYGDRGVAAGVAVAVGAAWAATAGAVALYWLVTGAWPLW